MTDALAWLSTYFAAVLFVVVTGFLGWASWRAITKTRERSVDYGETRVRIRHGANVVMDSTVRQLHVLVRGRGSPSMSVCGHYCNGGEFHVDVIPPGMQAPLVRDDGL